MQMQMQMHGKTKHAVMLTFPNGCSLILFLLFFRHYHDRL